MKKILIIKFVSVALLVVFVFVNTVLPKRAEAFIVHDPGHTVINVANGVLQGFISFFTGADYAGLKLHGPAQIQTAVNAGVDQSCDIGTQAIEQGSGFLNSMSGGLSLISGGSSEAAKLAPMIAALQARVTCFNAAIVAVEAQLAASVLETQSNDLHARLGVLVNKREQAQARLNQAQSWMNASMKDIWKAFAIRIGLNLFKNYSTKYANALIQKFKVNGHDEVLRALNTFYTLESLRKNYPGQPTEQIILRSILQAQQTGSAASRKTADTLIRNQAETNLGFDPLSVASDDPDFRSKMATVGMMPNTGPMLAMLKLDKADAVKAQATQAALSESTANGNFLSRRPCENKVAEQKNIDAQYQKSASDYSDDYEVYLELVDDYRKNGTYDTPEAQAQIAQAKQKLDSSRATLDNMPRAIPDSILKICDFVQMDGRTIGNTATNLLNNVIQQRADFKSDNLGTFLTTIADTFSGVISNVIDGRGVNSRTLLDAGLGLAYQGVSESANRIKSLPPTNAGSDPGSLIKFEITPKVRGGQEYAITVSIPKINSIECPCTLDITDPKTGTKEVTDSLKIGQTEQYIFDAPTNLTINGQPVSEATLTYNVRLIYTYNGKSFVKAQALQVLVQNPTSTVAGASTLRDEILFRGAEISLR